MASCIEVLIAGFPVASGGTVEFYQAGTSTPSTLVFTDPEGTISASAPHTLDGDGCIERYVKERVRIVVKDDVGATIKEWTHGQDAKTVTVENDMFIGSLPGGGTGPGGATTIDAGLDLMQVSFNAEDGLVGLTSGDTLLYTALAASSGVFYNGLAYGAIGNGIVDDTIAIQTAITAAINAGGGIVFLPAGTYSVSSLNISSGAGVTLMGVLAPTGGTKYTRIVANTSALTAALIVAADFTNVKNISFAAASTSITTPLVALSGGATGVHFENCSFLGGSAAIAASLVGPASGLPGATFSECLFRLQHASGTFISSGGAGIDFVAGQYTNCTFDFNSIAPTNVPFAVNSHVFTNCHFLLSSTTAVTNVFPTSAACKYTFIGGKIVTSHTSGASTIFHSGTVNMIGLEFRMVSSTVPVYFASGGTLVLQEAGCSFPATTFLNLAYGLRDWTSHSQWRSRYTSQSFAVAPFEYSPTPEATVHEIFSSASATFNFMAVTAMVGSYSNWWSPGELVKIVLHNTHVAACTPSWGATYQGAPTTAVPAGGQGVWVFQPSTSNELFYVGGSVSA